MYTVNIILHFRKGEGGGEILLNVFVAFHLFWIKFDVEAVQKKLLSDFQYIDTRRCRSISLVWALVNFYSNYPHGLTDLNKIQYNTSVRNFVCS